MKLSFFTICFLLTTICSFGQTYTLSGKITKNNHTLSGVNISVSHSDKGTVSDFKGHYSLQLSKGKYLLIFSYGNEKRVEVNLNGNKTLDVDLSNIQTQLSELLISSLRVDSEAPITHSNLSNKELNERNLGQSIPTLMNYMPNVVTTSDAGAGIGYSGIRVRGSDGTRVNVTINGVPLNDSEGQSTVWVDLGDFSNSIENLQLQRGVGTSTNGAGAFGASLNVLTDKIDEQASAEITNTYGSFDTRKHQVKFNTGLMDKHFAFTGNFSLLKSDGYRDRAFSDLKSYFLQGIYKNKNSLIKAIGFGGTEQTYQAYYGITAEQLKENRKFNPAGMYTDSTGTTQYYNNQTDNYKQDHFQLLWDQKYNVYWSSNLAFHYTYGRGYYESYHEDADLRAYGLPYFDFNGVEKTTSDLVNEKWLSNHFYGTVFDLTYYKRETKISFGGAWNHYSGNHYGDVIYTKLAQNNEPFSHYYDNIGTKTDFNFYVKATFALTDKLIAFGDLQLRNIHYKTSGPYEGQEFSIKDHFTFFNPKAGLTYQLNNNHQLYFSYARANKEPNRSDYKSAVLNRDPGEIKYPKEETLNDYELGWRWKGDQFHLSSNLYYMDYHNQLILTGDIDPEGRFIRKNSGESYRLGIEINAEIKITDNFDILPNLSLSQNKNKDFHSTIEGEVKSFGNTKISFSPQIVGGNMVRYRPVKNLQINFLTKFVGAQYLSNIEAKASKLDNYLVNSLNIQYSWNEVPLFKEVVFTGLVNNIFDEKYITNGYYSPGSGASYYPQAGINYLLGLSLKF